MGKSGKTNRHSVGKFRMQKRSVKSLRTQRRLEQREQEKNKED